MNLDTTLTEIAAFLDLDAAELITYAAEDTVGGFHFNDALSKWPGGSLWEVEGKVLYALVRALEPPMSLEMGTWHGASATHILSAIERSECGMLRSVDIWEGAGDLVPAELRQHWMIAYTEAVHYLQSPPFHVFSFVFEDMIHSESEVYAAVVALKSKLRTGAVVVHHDSEHGDDGNKVRAGLKRAGVDFRSWLIEPSDCGIAIWRAET